MKETPLKTNPDRVREFHQRARESSHRSLQASRHRTPPKGRARNSTLKQGTGFAVHPRQREAVQGLPCLGCGKHADAYRAIDPAHVWSRGRGVGDCTSRFCVVPLCRTVEGGCHRLLDQPSGGIDLLSVMVADWDRWRPYFVHALLHCFPLELVQRLTGERHVPERKVAS